MKNNNFKTHPAVKIINFLCFLTIAFSGQAILYSQKAITNESIWSDLEFFTRSLPPFHFMNDGRHYSILEENVINEYDIVTGEISRTILKGEDIQGPGNFMGNISDYKLDKDETRILITSSPETIFRRSQVARYHVYDIKNNTVSPLFEGRKISYATFSPAGDKIAFTFNNNLYFQDLNSGLLTQITFDGEKNKIINGSADWVYEEEFFMTRAFQWSPDSKKIAYLKFDESRVREAILTRYNNGPYPVFESYKYPKVGEQISRVSLFVFEIESGKKQEVKLGMQTDYYIPDMQWTSDPGLLSVTVINRGQDHLNIFLADLKDGALRTLVEEKSRSYVEFCDELTFLDDGSGFIRSGERNGYTHLLLNNMEGKLIRDLTPGNFDVKNFMGFDPKRNRIYYQAARNHPADIQIYSMALQGRYESQLTRHPGNNDAFFSSTFDYFILDHSTINEPPVYYICDSKGGIIRTIDVNEDLRLKQEEYNTQPIRFFDFYTPDSLQLHGWWVHPPSRETNVTFPLLMYVYGGPGSQEVTNKWKGDDYWWFQLLAQRGVAVACVDNRGTGGRGEKFRSSTYLRLGHYETLDQMAAVKFLGRLPEIDSTRTGVFGWSYGGFLALKCMLEGNEMFKLGIAVAPVTNWLWYNCIFSERHMKTIAENEAGYRKSNVLNEAAKLSGNLLLVHGMADDNVHFQHSAELMNALIRANKQFDTYIYPNRNHGIYGDNARLHLYTKMTNFIINNL